MAPGLCRIKTRVASQKGREKDGVWQRGDRQGAAGKDGREGFPSCSIEEPDLKWTPLRVHGSCYCGNPTGQTLEVHVKNAHCICISCNKFFLGHGFVFSFPR